MLSETGFIHQKPLKLLLIDGEPDSWYSSKALKAFTD